MYRTGQEFAILPKQTKIHSPGVKSNAVKVPRLLKADMYFFHQRLKVPAEMSLIFVRQVVKAVDFFIGELPVFINCLDGPAAGCAKVEGQYDIWAAHRITPFFNRMLA